MRDLSENDFVDLIESKNQDKRFEWWFNFQPLFYGIDDPLDPVVHAHKTITDQTEEVMQFFTFL